MGVEPRRMAGATVAYRHRSADKRLRTILLVLSIQKLLPPSLTPACRLGQSRGPSSTRATDMERHFTPVTAARSCNAWIVDSCTTVSGPPWKWYSVTSQLVGEATAMKTVPGD
jgi:hypothetical protein